MKIYVNLWQYWNLVELLSGSDYEDAYYMPHRPVFKDSSYSVRPVFDAGAKDSNGTSLNSCLEVGPNLLPDLVDIFLRFRTSEVGIVSDIEKAFMQIEVNPSQRDLI